jgi:hypothetical protein
VIRGLPSQSLICGNQFNFRNRIWNPNWNSDREFFHHLECFFSIFKLKLPPTPFFSNLQLCVAGWIGPVWQVSVQASFAIPITEGGIIKPQILLYSIILWSWLFLDAFACSLQTQSHQAKVWCAWQVPWCQLHCKRKPSVMGIAVRFVTFFLPFLPLETLCVCNYNLQFSFT